MGSTAWGAGLDGHRSAVPPHDGQTGGLGDDLPQVAEGQGVVAGHGALEGQPVVRATEGGATELVLGDAFTSQLQGIVFPWAPWGLEAHLPVRWAAASDVSAGGPALGDGRVRAWWRPMQGSVAAGLGVGTWLPTGSVARTHSTGRVVPTATATLTARRGPVRLSGAVGAELEGRPEPVEAVGGAVGLASAGAHWIGSAGAVGVSVAGRRPFDTEIAARRGAAAEVALDATWGVSDRVSLAGLVGASPTAGVGPVWRGSLGATVRWGQATPVVEAVGRVVRVVDPDGRPVAAATLRDGDRTWSADARGRLTPADGATGTVTARGLGAATLARDDREVVLPWGTVPLRVEVVAADGGGLSPTIRLEGPDGATEPLAPAELPSLGPGEWMLSIEAEGYGTQQRSVRVPPRAVEAVELEVALLPRRGDARLDLSLTDVDGGEVRGAEVRLDGVSVGTSGGERVGVEGLAAGDLTIEVGRHAFREQAVDVALAGDGVAEVDVALGFAPGTVRLVAEGPEGPLTDAMLYVAGPQALPPLPLGDEGRTVLRLAPGEWTLALSSPAHGLQERLLVVDDDSPVPIDVGFVLLSEELGSAELWVQVRDVTGDPVAGAEVRLDGMPVGRTTTGGELRVADLQPRTLTVAVDGLGLVAEEQTVTVPEGMHRADVVVAWEAGTLEVSARDPEGPVDALVAFDGPAPYDGGPLGAPGRRTFVQMPSGAWEVLASHEAGMEVAWTMVADRPGRRAEVAMRLGEDQGDGVLDLMVTDPEGRPVAGALVSVDGRPLVSTADGGRVRVRGLASGTRDVVVTHPHFVPSDRAVRVSEDPQPASLALSWRPGVLDIVGQAGGVPVVDGMLYATGPDDVPPLAPQPLDGDGMGRIVVAPGTWEFVVSSAQGMVARSVEVPDTPRPPERVAIDVDPRDDVLVHVVTGFGGPVAGASLIDGTDIVATTDGSGLARVSVEGRRRKLLVRHPDLLPSDALLLRSDDDERWIEVAYRPIDVLLTLRAGEEPVSAEVRAIGPTRVDPVSIDGDGALSLPPGDWEIVVDAGNELAAARQVVWLQPGQEATRLDFSLAAPMVQATSTGLEVSAVLFEVGEATPTAAYERVLEELASRIVSEPRIRQVRVQGHTDATGDLAYNYGLSRRRAETVVATLIANGVPPVLLRAKGYGPSRPRAGNDTEAGRAQNRRVDFLTTLSEGSDASR